MLNLIERLRSEPDIIRLECPKYKREDLSEVDYTLFKTERVNDKRGLNVKRQIEIISNYLCDTYLFYDSLDDSSRRKKENELNRKYGQECEDLHQKGRLRINKICPVLSCIKFLNEDLKKPNKRIGEIAQEMHNRFYGKYYLMSNPERVAFSEDLMSRIIEILGVIS